MPEIPIFQNNRHVEQDYSTFLRLGIRPIRDPNAMSLARILREREIMAPELDPHIFILTPNTDARAEERGIRTPLRWQQKVEQLAGSLERLSGQRPEIVGYERRIPAEAHGQRPTAQRPYAGWGARAILEVDMNDESMDIPGETDDSPDTVWLASWRLWMEDRVIHSETFCPT
ncbi:MAG: hypothetical protein Q9165_005027 [Trypethelium subeluteriae]